MHNNNECYYKTMTNRDGAVFSEVDNHFRDLALKMGGNEVIIPAMIKKSVLERCGYFQSFPHHLTIINNYMKSDNAMNSSSYTAESNEMFLTPAACLHIYPMLEGEKVKNTIITTKARVYRYEGDNFNGSTRLWDFSVREIVAIGSEEFVLSVLLNIQKESLEYCVKKNISATIKTATDPFYPSKRNDHLIKIQKANHLKKELLTVVNGKEVAIASFNLHGTHFSKSFDFDQSGSIVSGCVGFGLERWVAALR